MSDVSLDDWIGRTQTMTDILDPSHAALVAATLGQPAPGKGDPMPELWHWCFFLEAVSTDLLGTDGHAARGGFLPPAEGRNRMWAGGRVYFDSLCSLALRHKRFQRSLTSRKSKVKQALCCL